MLRELHPDVAPQRRPHRRPLSVLAYGYASRSTLLHSLSSQAKRALAAPTRATLLLVETCNHTSLSRARERSAHIAKLDAWHGTTTYEYLRHHARFHRLLPAREERGVTGCTLVAQLEWQTTLEHQLTLDGRRYIGVAFRDAQP